MKNWVEIKKIKGNILINIDGETKKLRNIGYQKSTSVLLKKLISSIIFNIRIKRKKIALIKIIVFMNLASKNLIYTFMLI